MSRQPPARGQPFGVDSWDSHGTPDEFETTQRLLAAIPGGQELLDWCDGVASFHDAEVVRIHLDRESSSRLELAIQGPRGAARVTFVLTDWINADISGFSHQNVIGQLFLAETEDRQVRAWERGVGLRSGDHQIKLCRSSAHMAPFVQPSAGLS